MRRVPGWYVACLSQELRTEPLGRCLLGTRMALFRDGGGRAAALLDRCPHRNVPLSLGTVTDAGRLQCAYHGWQFDGDGGCRSVPGLVDQQERRARRVEAFTVRELDGFVWVAPLPNGPDEAALPEPFRLPHVDDPAYTTVRRSLRVQASLHAAVENTLDVPHTAFLHGGLFRGGREPVDIEVVVRHGTDRVEADYIGEPRPSGLAGRILAPGGGVVAHTDRFVLPCVAQVEYRLGESHLVTTSAFTPVDDHETRMFAAVTFRLPLPPALAKAAFIPVANRIFGQDARILSAQSASMRRWGGEHFASTELDVLGNSVQRLLRNAERGVFEDAPPAPHRFTIRV